jgi:protocatechuate 3,4-dioxygenase beta subunit
MRSLPAASLAALLLAAPAAHAQAPAPLVRGVVVDSASGRHVGGLTVRLLDSAGTSLNGAITDASGRFSMRMVPGRYAFRVQRVGFRSTVTPALAIRGDTTLRLAAPWEAVAIAPIRTVGRSECALRAAERSETAALWDEARKALDAAAIARAQPMLRLTVVDIVRELDPSGEKVLSEQRAERTGLGLSAYRSRHPDSLAAQGYVRAEGETIWYYSPDADVLLSDGFLRTHCFRLQNDPAHPELAGLAFEPVRGRREPDVRGVLWVDRATRELLSLDYTYTSYPESRWPQAARGRVEFARLPSGAWMVRRWVARAPLLRRKAVVQVQRSGGGGPISNELPRFSSRGELDLSGVHEQAGEVLLATTADGTPLFARQVGALEGTVADSATGAPLAGARVTLQGTGRLAVADERGRWRLDSVPAGGFGVTFSHPAADTLVVDAPTQRVSVAPDRTTTVALLLPPATTLKARACAADFSSAGTHAAVVGVVTDGATGVPVPGAAVTVAWSTFARSAGVIAESVKQTTTTTDASGQYRVCTLPGDGDRITVQAGAGALSSAPVVLQVAPGRVARRDLALRPASDDR